MKKLATFFCLIFLLVSASASAEIAVIVNKDLYPSIKTAVDQYVSDLRSDGETVYLDTATFDAGSSREELRALRTLLRNRYHNASDPLSGAVLIGELPRADYETFHTVDNVEVVEETYPIDYYFMDLDKATDEDWKDAKGETDVFDGYDGDRTMEIWVSRIIAHNFIHESESVVIGVPKGTSSKYDYGNEVDIINAYLARVHERMTQPARVPRRAIQVGDFKNWFNESNLGVQDLGIPYDTLKYPHDTPAIWARELRRGYELAGIFEHSSPHVHAFALDQPENSTGSFWSYHHEWISPSDKVFLHMPVEGGPSRVPFFSSLGCSNLQYDEENCLGQMYAMLHSGLISLGSTTLNWGHNSYVTYSKALADGKSFGEAFLEYVNQRHDSYTTLVMTLLGAGTLRLQPYVENLEPVLTITDFVVDKDELGPYPGPDLHGDTLRLSAVVESDPPGKFDPYSAIFTWDGLEDSISDDGADFVLEGHNLPGYGSNEGEYFMTLEVQQPGCQSAVAVLSLRGWTFRKVGPTYSYYFNSTETENRAHLNRHYRVDGQWEAHIRGLSKDIGGTDDDFVFYSTDIISGDFEITTRVKDWRNSGTAEYDPWAKAGVMIRLDDNSQGSANAFAGITRAHGAVFQVRAQEGGDTSVITLLGFSAGDWVKLRRQGRTVYGYASKDGVGFTQIGSATIGPVAQPSIGFAYSCNDETPWLSTGTDFTKERGVVFSHMKVKKLSIPSPVVPFIEYVNREADGTYTAYFGFSNPNDFDVMAKAGTENEFIYEGTGDLPEPITEFSSGTVKGAFGVSFDGSQLQWTLHGKTVTATRTGAKTYRITPYVERVINNCDGTYTAHFGYSSPHPFAVVKERGKLNELDFSGGGYYWEGPVTEFETGRVYEAFAVDFDGSDLTWKLDGQEAVATGTMAANVCPAFRFFKAFAFGADGFTRAVPNAPGTQYIKVVQNGSNFLYDPSRGYGYIDIEQIDDTPNNRNILSGNDEIYDQFIGVKARFDYGYYHGYMPEIVFRIDVPDGIYRFVAAGGDAQYGNHATTIRVSAGQAYMGGYADTVSLVEDIRAPKNTFYRVGFDDKLPPAGDRSGTQPKFLPVETSPYFRVPSQYHYGYGDDEESGPPGSHILIHQVAGLTDPGWAIGGDLCLLELWYIPDTPSETGGEVHNPPAHNVGVQTFEVTETGVWRKAERYYGLKHIDEIRPMRDACGVTRTFVVGWHQNDLAEYLMKFGGDYTRLVLRGKAARPAPVVVDILIDGEVKGRTAWTAGNDCSQDISVEIPGIPYGTHAIAVRFANDFYDPKNNIDRNLYLEALLVPEPADLPSVTHGLPKGRFCAWGRCFKAFQSDEVTPVNTWRPADRFYGHQGIDQIEPLRDGCGKTYTYAVGWHQDDLIEYLMKMGGQYSYLILRGMADRPGPVDIEIWVDGEFYTTAAWEGDNNATRDIAVYMGWLPYGTHAVAVKFARDAYTPGGGADKDLNLYLSALKVNDVGIRNFASDETWKSTDQYEEGWHETDFQDWQWQNAYAPYPNPYPPAHWICGTEAELIWHYPYPRTPDGKDGPRDAWFRKTFYLGQDALWKIQNAAVTVIADDDFELYVNGKKVMADWDGRLAATPYTVNIKSYLKSGQNALAVHARDTYGIYEFLLVDVTID